MAINKGRENFKINKRIEKREESQITIKQNQGVRQTHSHSDAVTERKHLTHKVTFKTQTHQSTQSFL